MVGVIICLLVSGVHSLHLVLQITGTALIIHCLPPSRCHQVCLLWCFSYLTAFRLSARLGLPEPPAHTNAIILILTLKLTGVAFEYHDEAERDPSVSPPAPVDIFHYSLGHIGLITGPYYKYSTWRGLYDHSWNPGRQSGWGWGVCEAAALKRARNVPFYVLAFLLSSHLFPLAVVETQEWQEETGLLWKMFYMMPIFFSFRMRIYAGFTLSECACIMAGLGGYPESSQPRPGQGPTRPDLLDSKEPGELSFETVHNIDEWGSDFVPSMREALRCWNMTVQHWLVFVVYKRFPVRSLRTGMVMLVSSLWHGVHPGYYLSLGSVPFCLMVRPVKPLTRSNFPSSQVEDYYRRILRSRLSEASQKKYDWINWFVRMRWFDYLGMGFLLLRIDATITYWVSVYFVGHVSLIILSVIGFCLVNPFMKKIAGEKRKSE